MASDREAERLIDLGDARAVLVIPPRLHARLLGGERVPVQVIINGDNANTAATVMGYALRILQTVSLQYQLQAASRPGGPMVSVEPRVWYNPELRSALFLVPGLIAYIGMISSVVSTALSVVREKERGTMEQVRMAPLGTRCLHRRQNAAVLRHFGLLVYGHHSGLDGAVRACRCEAPGCCCFSRSRSILRARSVSG